RPQNGMQKCPAALKYLRHEGSQRLRQNQKHQEIDRYLKNSHRAHIRTFPASAGRRGDKQTTLRLQPQQSCNPYVFFSFTTCRKLWLGPSKQQETGNQPPCRKRRAPISLRSRKYHFMSAQLTRQFAFVAGPPLSRLA